MLAILKTAFKYFLEPVGSSEYLMISIDYRDSRRLLPPERVWKYFVDNEIFCLYKA